MTPPTIPGLSLTLTAQVGKFVVGQAGESDEQVREEEVAEGLRFPALFRGEGVRGHAYHVFDEPRYYR